MCSFHRNKKVVGCFCPHSKPTLEAIGARYHRNRGDALREGRLVLSVHTPWRRVLKNLRACQSRIAQKQELQRPRVLPLPPQLHLIDTGSER